MKNQIKNSPAKSSQKDISNASKSIQESIESRLKDIPRGGIGGNNSPQLYKIEGWDQLSDRDKKSYRRKMRSKLQRFSDDILGKDRSDSERLNACKEFMNHFKDNYLSDSLAISSIYQGSNPSKRKEIEDMIFIINALIKK